MTVQPGFDAGYHLGITEFTERYLRSLTKGNLQQISNGAEARWMTLLEALGRRPSAKKCHSVDAQVYLKQRIGQKLIPIEWANSKGPGDKPDSGTLQRSQLALSDPGLAPCSRSLRLRSLLVLRSAVHAMWPKTTSEGFARPEVTSRDTSAPEKAAEKYRQWMSLVEAVEHIRISQPCDSIEALRQLKREIRDGLVRLQWEDTEGPKDCPDPEYLQESQLLLIGTGWAPDKDSGYRALLVDRSDVEKLWPLSNYPRETRQKIDDDDIRSVARDIYEERKNDPPNVPAAEQLIRQRILGAKRDDIRRILEEFAELRRKAGNQPKV